MVVNLMKIVCVFAQLTIFVQLATTYTCQTPDEWLSVSTKDQLWPSGIVKYKLHQTLSFNDILEVKKAFDEYHTKTCIRFQPAKDDDQDFVSIELDNDICGKAHVCKQGGYQYAKFGGECRNMATMVHELAHTLCLGHEHQRSDRDNYLNFQNCNEIPLKNSPDSYSSKGIYDYVSQMHYDCNSCFAGRHICGHTLTPGLSALDVDFINALYNCQGCHRHRWRPAESLTNEEIGNMQHFNQYATDGTPIFPCRTVVGTELITGLYNPSEKSCTASYINLKQTMRTGVEVLTIPGGFDGQCSIYKLVDRAEVSLKTAVQVGTSFRYKNWKSFLAYANVTSFRVVTGVAVGKIWVFDGKNFDNRAELPFDDRGYNSPVSQILSCIVDTDCMIKQLFLERNN
ncbi:Zinc metalloproteinase nas-1 [Orchesella cincta]|uniref:Metalloendopeptidase n=1 Tax=Orchesella cincta TaxID=48709 RepID=A0A1D2MQT1_ORCCI|nr:Zinc metalloproteinase nas-1 [Orchesella cincta]